MIDQDTLERLILENLWGAWRNIRFWRVTENIGVWRLELQAHQEEIVRPLIEGASFLEITRELPISGERNMGTMFDLRFRTPPRIVYGEPDAELRAAGVKVSKELEHWNDKLDLTCRFCEGSYMYHGADCPIPVFLEDHKE